MKYEIDEVSIINRPYYRLQSFNITGLNKSIESLMATYILLYAPYFRLNLKSKFQGSSHSFRFQLVYYYQLKK